MHSKENHEKGLKIGILPENEKENFKKAETESGKWKQRSIKIVSGYLK